MPKGLKKNWMSNEQLRMTKKKKNYYQKAICLYLAHETQIVIPHKRHFHFAIRLELNYLRPKIGQVPFNFFVFKKRGQLHILWLNWTSDRHIWNFWYWMFNLLFVLTLVIPWVAHIYHWLLRSKIGKLYMSILI